MSLFGIGTNKSKKISRPELVISAPLGDVRHVGHIGRDGDDFGEEHLYQSNEKHANVAGRTGHGANQRFTYVSQHDSPIIKSAIPLSQANKIPSTKHNSLKATPVSSIVAAQNQNNSKNILGNKTESHDSGNYTSEYEDNVDRLSSGFGKSSMNMQKGNPLRASGHSNLSIPLKNNGNEWDSLSDVAETDNNNNSNNNTSLQKEFDNDEDSTSLLGDVLAVMDFDKYASIPGVKHSASQFSTFQHTSSNNTPRSNATTNINAHSELNSTFNNNNNNNNYNSAVGLTNAKITHNLTIDTQTIDSESSTNLIFNSSHGSQKQSVSAMRSIEICRNDSFVNSQAQLVSKNSQRSITIPVPSNAEVIVSPGSGSSLGAYGREQNEIAL